MVPDGRIIAAYQSGNTKIFIQDDCLRNQTYEEYLEIMGNISRIGIEIIRKYEEKHGAGSWDDEPEDWNNPSDIVVLPLEQYVKEEDREDVEEILHRREEWQKRYLEELET